MKTRVCSVAAAWLLGFAPGAFAADGPCSIPAGYANHASHTENGLKYTFALDQFIYAFMADTIRFHYAVENVGTERVVISFYCQQQNVFAIYPSECLTLDQPGCLEAAIFFLPQLCSTLGSEIDLLPGDCEAYSVAWRQNPNIVKEHAPGAYRAFAGLWRPGSPGDGWPGVFVGPSGLTLDLTIEDTPNPVKATTWGAVKALYR